MPSCNLPQSTVTKKNLKKEEESKRSLRKKNRDEELDQRKPEENNFSVVTNFNISITTIELHSPTPNIDDSKISEDNTPNTNDSEIFKNSTPNVNINSCLLNEKVEVAKNCLIDIGMQVKSGDLITDFCDVINTNEDLNTITGINDFDILNELMDIVELGYPQYKLNRKVKEENNYDFYEI